MKSHFSLEIPGGVCPDCGKTHGHTISELLIASGALREIPELMRRHGFQKPFLLSDPRTERAAGKALKEILQAEGIPYGSYVFLQETPEPDERAVGSAVMHFDASCDFVIAVGSGVLNDIGKILSKTANRPYLIAVTAPSVDGYASATSSVALDGLKVSLPSKCPEFIVGDLDVLKNAPMRMLLAGLGDMLAKYVSLCEWRIAALVCGEFYCGTIAQMVRDALKKCTDSADGLLKREENAVRAVFDGLIIGGIAMNYAGLSRPASGVEHYFSHIWDMRGLSFGTAVDLHGIQCAVGTYQALRIYDKVKRTVPDAQKADANTEKFDFNAWSGFLREFVGDGAEAMIAAEAKDRKYAKEEHEKRFGRICEHWDAITAVMREELPDSAELKALLDRLGMPSAPSEIGIPDSILPPTFLATKDIRNKYVLSTLCWDLGIAEETAAGLAEDPEKTVEKKHGKC